MSEPKTTFEAWCLVELFGHVKIAGKCTEQNIAGANMLRVDVPETSTKPAFTRFFGSAAIYGINPIEESIARQLAESYSPTAFSTYELKPLIAKMQKALPPSAFTMEEE